MNRKQFIRERNMINDHVGMKISKTIPVKNKFFHSLPTDIVLDNVDH